MAAKWNPDAAVPEGRVEETVLTEHAWERMSGRRVSPAEIALVLRRGRMARTKGSCIFSIGRREVEHASDEGLDIRRLEGVHVVTSEESGHLVVLTVFRNRDFSCLKLRTAGRYRPRWNVRDAA